MKKTSMKNILSGKTTKPTAKKTVKKKPAKDNMPMDTMMGPKTVRITKADNGLTVSTYTKDGEQVKVAKSSAEAMRHCKDMLDC